MARVKIKINRRGLRDLLTSEGVAADLLRRAEQVATAAQGQAVPPHDGTVEYRAESENGSKRARAIVVADHPGALGQEADYRILGSSIDAAGT